MTDGGPKKKKRKKAASGAGRKISKSPLFWCLNGGLAAALAIAAAILLPPVNSDSGSLPGTLTRMMACEVVNAYPHDTGAFTQGLIYRDGFFYESTGLYGQSTLRKVDIETGAVLRKIHLSPRYFAEGLTDWKGRLIQLTWREHTGFIYAMDDFSLIGDFSYSTEGWGLTHDGSRLIKSDGSHYLYFLDPENFLTVRRLPVTDNGAPVAGINEMEYIRGEIFANIWMTDRIARIDPAGGSVTGWIDCTGLLPREARTPDTDVMNGIAWDEKENRLFVTGKRWPYVYEIRLIPAGSNGAEAQEKTGGGF
ncbi:MAG TPA: glutaminyl-peptide cyclotransferase [Acidobacteriota bacterium]|nr:glutaminyl-peptide cyclotransferase [Acidobacteriota bacterium]